MADGLMYFIADRMLVGDVNGVHFQETAVSGGRAGRKDPITQKTLPPIDPSLANNVWLTDRKGIVFTKILGGPIPCGDYTVTAKPSTDGKNLRLDLVPAGFIPVISDGIRDGHFQIHGRGFWGSYGCIVLLDGAKLQLLYNAVRSSKEVKLCVVAGTIDDIA